MVKVKSKPYHSVNKRQQNPSVQQKEKQLPGAIRLSKSARTYSHFLDIQTRLSYEVAEVIYKRKSTCVIRIDDTINIGPTQATETGVKGLKTH